MLSLAELVLESATDYAIITMDLRGQVTYWSPGAEAILGWSSAEMLGQNIDCIFTPEDRGTDTPSKELGNALTEGRSIDERWHIRKNGTVFWASGEMLPLVEEGTPEGFPKILRDRTPQKRAEELQHILTQELGHRIKNMIAVIQSIVNQSFRGAEDIASIKKSISDRLSVLTGAQDILLAGNTGGTELNEVVAKSIAIAQDKSRHKRVLAEGPAIHVGPRAAMSIALIIHELLTNALKYGALSQDEGVVDINWRVSELKGLPALELVWTEKGGPAVVQPTRSGFGSRLVQSGITGTRSVVELEYAAQGLQCRIQAVLDDVQSN